MPGNPLVSGAAEIFQLTTRNVTRFLKTRLLHVEVFVWGKFVTTTVVSLLKNGFSTFRLTASEVLLLAVAPLCFENDHVFKRMTHNQLRSASK